MNGYSQFQNHKLIPDIEFFHFFQLDMRQNPQQKIMIQGNTDDRGTAEYNLALGQRRSDAVRRAFAALGVPDGQIEAVSLGKEKPKAEGNNEAAWAENRRADIIYLTK